MNKKCDACGEEVQGGIGMGGALLCRGCAEDVRSEVEGLRAGKKQVNIMGIARRMYREKHSTTDYLLRDIPEEMMREMKIQAAKEKGTVRDLIIVAVAVYLAQK